MSTATLTRPIEGPASGTSEWLDFRMTGIGASEAGAACGVSRWQSPLQIYLRKRRELPPIEDNDAMRLGRKLEPIVVSEFCERTGMGVKRYPCPAARHAKHEFMLATPDVELDSEELLECKTTSRFLAKAIGDEGTDDLDSSVVMQCQQQLAVMDLGVCHVATLVDGRQLLVHRVDRNDKLIARMVEIEAELWQRIADGRPPEPDWSHKATPDLIKELYGVETGETKILSAEFADLWRQQDAIGKRMSADEKERKLLRAKFAFEMGTAAVAIFEAENRESAVAKKIKEIEQEAETFRAQALAADARLRELRESPDSSIGGPIDLQVTRKKVDNKGYTVKPFSYFLMSESKGKK